MNELHFYQNNNNKSLNLKNPDVIFLSPKLTKKLSKKLNETQNNNLNNSQSDHNCDKSDDLDLIKILNGFVFIIFFIFIVILNILCLFALPYFFQESLSIYD